MDIEMKDHNCPVEGEMQVEAGAECNWCGELIEGGETMGMIDIINVKENEDGSADVEINCSNDIIEELIREGFRDIIEEEKKKVVVLPPIEPYDENVKTYELSDEDAQFLMNRGFIRAIESGLKKSREFEKSVDIEQE